jgi:hypothetical protein
MVSNSLELVLSAYMTKEDITHILPFITEWSVDEASAINWFLTAAEVCLQYDAKILIEYLHSSKFGGYA